ncbi:hypothetical protein HYS91_02515 [Candidatus Daviesbacteria bacterium]|nr:hypothetical protein [Candidatus Daviesbacteria bacterium]
MSEYKRLSPREFAKDLTPNDPFGQGLMTIIGEIELTYFPALEAYRHYVGAINHIKLSEHLNRLHGLVFNSQEYNQEDEAYWSRAIRRLERDAGISMVIATFEAVGSIGAGFVAAAITGRSEVGWAVGFTGRPFVRAVGMVGSRVIKSIRGS